MKNILFTLTALMALLFSSCHSEEMRIKETGKGEVSLAKFTISVELEIGDIEFSRADDVDVSNFIITIKDAKGEEVGNWIYGEMPEIISLEVGNYTVEAVSSSQPTIGIDKPYYKGEQEFTIEANKLTEVETIECKLANICVTFEFDDDFADLIGDDFEAIFKIGDNSVTMTKDDEGKKAYLPAVTESNSLDITWKGTLDGEAKEGTMRQDNIQAGEMHTVNFNLDKVEGAYPFGLKVSILIDETISRVDDMLVVNPGSEPPLEDFPAEDGGEDEGTGTGGGTTPGAPAIVGTDFKGSPFDIDSDVLEVKKGETATLKVTLSSSVGIGHVYVTIDSETLTPDVLQSVGLTSSFDLVEPGQYESALKGLGFPVADEVKGKKTILFDITKFTELLGIYGEADHNFILRVSDTNGNSTTKTLKVKSI